MWVMGEWSVSQWIMGVGWETGGCDWWWLGAVDSGCHKLSENIWFVWSRTPYSGEKVGCDACPRTTECEDRARILKQNSQLSS